MLRAGQRERWWQSCGQVWVRNGQAEHACIAGSLSAGRRLCHRKAVMLAATGVARQRYPRAVQES